ncbi:MAG: hypothetical protein H8E66_29700 [Planctomycetes bacterium]|nr:hypothetical protein [Planctomycetota bacterium]
MPCVHLKKLYQLCQDESVKISGADLVHIVCEQCGVKDVCPSMLLEHFEVKEDHATTLPSPAEQ